jgi:ketosteroid isomerase-like protein
MSDVTDAAYSLAERFREALDRLERQGQVDELVGLYREGCELTNTARTGRYEGHDGARRFWERYRATFSELHTSYRTVVATADVVVLEWSTEGWAGGREVAYDGVTVLALADGGIVRSAAYFDPRRLGRALLGERPGGHGAASAPGPPDRDRPEEDPAVPGVDEGDRIEGVDEADTGESVDAAREPLTDEGWVTDPTSTG